MRTFAAIAALACLGLPAGALAELRAYDVDAKYRQEIYEALAGCATMMAPTAKTSRTCTRQHRSTGCSDARWSAPSS